MSKNNCSLKGVDKKKPGIDILGGIVLLYTHTAIAYFSEVHILQYHINKKAFLLYRRTTHNTLVV